MRIVKKTLSVLSILFVFQFATSCFWSCKCDDYGSFEVEYVNLLIIPFDNARFVMLTSEDSVYKESFAISLIPKTESRSIAGKISIGKFGFSSAMACDCPGPDYRYIDPIEFIRVKIINPSTLAETDATGMFGYSAQSGQLETIEDASFESYDINDLMIQLIQFESVPPKAIFKVSIVLKSGEEITAETEELHFL